MQSVPEAVRVLNTVLENPQISLRQSAAHPPMALVADCLADIGIADYLNGHDDLAGQQSRRAADGTRLTSAICASYVGMR